VHLRPGPLISKSDENGERDKRSARVWPEDHMCSGKELQDLLDDFFAGDGLRLWVVKAYWPVFT